ncbi:hypothetical protein SSX86_023912 [Deinandra increscens subsp. villosa]|uniref:THH1/TOM1/TOM3 domain-containing protein n=1 Tax=Deinandra increscens subsp. villosa TaxID=3103831 RepID=A0AAP0GRC7_9ASTR
MNYIVNGVRAVVFGFHMQVFNLHPKVSIWVLLEVPGLLFFLVLFWAEIYHQARSLPTDKLKTTYVCVNVGVYVIQFPPTRRLSPLPLLCSFWRDSSTADAASPPATHCHHQQSGSGDLLPLPTSAILPSGDPLTSTILPPSRHQD